MNKLYVENSTQINALPARVWEVLTKPNYIREWDDVPENFTAESLELNSEMRWHHDGKTTSLTVTEMKPLEHLKLALQNSSWKSPSWKSPPPQGDIAYTYTLSKQNEKTLFTIGIGDFAKLPDGQAYYDASIEFAETALPKIKALAEG
jgi:uncharacterized protein YndB with AHSA1/START domain